MATWTNITHCQEHKCYGIVVEWKSEGPLIMEGKPMTYHKAKEKARELENSTNVIRVAVFQMKGGFWGNETLIPVLEEV